MNSVLARGAYGAFALCLVGMVAWPLWSDNDLWAFLFAAVGIAVLLPVILGPSIRAVRAAFSSSGPPTLADCPGSDGRGVESALMGAGQPRSATRWFPVISVGGVVTMWVGADRVLDATGDLGWTYAYIGLVCSAAIALTIYVKRRG